MATPNVPPIFPRKIDQCARATDAFFTCFSEKSKPAVRSPDDAGAALRDCAKELAAYETCMQRHMGAKERSAILYRAPEPYRVRK